jgi:DNA mismatch repair protein MutS2
VSRTAEDVLEFDKLRELLRRRTTCTPGARTIDALSFSQDRSALEAAFALIAEGVSYLADGSELGFGSLPDPARWLAELEAPVAVLTPPMLIDAAALADTAAMLRDAFREAARPGSGSTARQFPLLSARAASVADLRPLAVAIRRAILPNGEISDDASPELRRIRVSMGRTRETIQKTLEQMLRARAGNAGEDYVTLRNDRFVIPVRAAERRQVQGVVHAASATGQTVFVEPFETVEHNNRLVQLAEDEAAEITRILAELTERLRANLGPLRFAVETIAELDSTFARARFAREFDCTLPQFTNEKSLAPSSPDQNALDQPSLELPSLELKGARHPVLADTLRAHGRSVVPMTLALGGTKTVLVISGPNTGGKTVTLKTVGLAVLSAQSAIPVAAETARLPLVDRVLVDIGDEQSIAADLSTFSSHMLNLKSMLEEATPKSLVLVDEMGTGTAPEEGAALAVALLEEFRNKQCFVLATTHHDRLKTYASTTPGVVNAAVEFDDVNLRPTYRLMVGVPGGSSGIAIAKRLKLPGSIIEHARSLLAPEAQEAADLITYLHRSRDELDRLRAHMAEERRALEAERAELRNEWVERQKQRIAELEQKFAEMHKRFEENVASVVEAVKERELRGHLEKTARRKMLEARGEAKEELNAAVVQTISASHQDLGVKAETLEKVNAARLQPGVRIRVRGFQKPVILRRVDGPSAEIEAGPLRMKVAVDEITGIEDQTKVRPSPRENITVRSQVSAEGTAGEINVIGMTVEEASARVDKLLDDAALAHRSRIRIIHGHGTGALRKGLREFLSTHPLVEKHAFETEERGGKAITVVDLRM